MLNDREKDNEREELERLSRDEEREREYDEAIREVELEREIEKWSRNVIRTDNNEHDKVIRM